MAHRRLRQLRRPQRVLILEDETLVALELQLLVEDMGHKVCAVADTEAAAIRAADEIEPDLVIADIQLRQGTGIGAAERICVRRPIPIIFVSGNQAFNPHPVLHSARFLAKPFRIEMLQQAIQDALSGDH